MSNRFLSMTRMCLNNWHYINKKILNFNNTVNFFTGHSGSGKSTVIDAIQMLLYADTTGRGFFNKAAKDDSNRTLIEYLRGMIQIEENNEVKYLRNNNFSSTVVIEYQNTETKKYQCMGVAFDIDTSNNDITKQWFWHTGPLLENKYRIDERKPLSIDNLRDFIKKNFPQDEYFLTKTDIKFKNEIYNNYFGGIPAEHYISLFKKAVPFKVDMKLDDFIKNYIFTEVNIHIDDMKDSVTQYSNLKLKLEDTKKEIEFLTVIHNQYEKYAECCNKDKQYKYNLDKLEIKAIEQYIQLNQTKQGEYSKDIVKLADTIETFDKNIEKMQSERDKVAGFIQNSGYKHLEEQLRLLNDNIEVLGRSKAKYDKLAHNLAAWLEAELLEPRIEADIKHFVEYKADHTEMEHIKSNIAEVKASLGHEKEDLDKQIGNLSDQISKVSKEIEEYKKGHKNYDSELLNAKAYIAEELKKYYGKPIHIDILADVLEVKDEEWLNAVEGYMGNNKTNLIVEPNYVKKAMELYRKLDAKKYYQISVVDTEKVLENARIAKSNSLAEEVKTSTNYVKAYIDYLMGHVIKCETIDDLRKNNSGITKDCVLYQGYTIRHINPYQYTKGAYIGQDAIERKLKSAEDTLNNFQAKKLPLDIRIREISNILTFESFNDISEYEQWLDDKKTKQSKENEKQDCINEIDNLKKTNLVVWQEKLIGLDETLKVSRSERSNTDSALTNKSERIEELKNEIITYHENLIEKQNLFIIDGTKEGKFQEFMMENEGKKTENIRNWIQYEKETNMDLRDQEFIKLSEKRQEHYNMYSYRGFAVHNTSNEEYDNQLQILSSDKLAKFIEKADEQARLAIYHFKTDFVYKIRAAIIDARKQKDDLNVVLNQLDFGKDKYNFTINKSTGEEGKFYDMFMDENLDIKPSQLKDNMWQEDLFSINHESAYKDLINELIEMFIPPTNSDTKTLETARANMERYSDYRTYLSFDMQQRVNGGHQISVSKMLSKNSGGEGQNPMYVALLASFAQIYRINLSSKIKRRPTPRLVILDEAFSKMDGEKVATCIGLIKSLHIQAIISAPNDKLQNYTEDVDKIFLYANQNKTHISIEEFEQERFYELLESTEEYEG